MSLHTLWCAPIEVHCLPHHMVCSYWGTLSPTPHSVLQLGYIVSHTIWCAPIGVHCLPQGPPHPSSSVVFYLTSGDDIFLENPLNLPLIRDPAPLVVWFVCSKLYPPHHTHHTQGTLAMHLVYVCTVFSSKGSHAHRMVCGNSFLTNLNF